MKTQGLQLSLKASYALTNDWDIYVPAQWAIALNPM